MAAPDTWVVVGASRGIGLEFVRQLLERGNQVIAAVRDPATASKLWQIAASQSRPGSCLIEQCDVTSEASIEVSIHQVDSGWRADRQQTFAAKLGTFVDQGMRIGNVVLNAGILQYPNRATEMYLFPCLDCVYCDSLSSFLSTTRSSWYTCHYYTPILTSPHQNIQPVRPAPAHQHNWPNPLRAGPTQPFIHRPSFQNYLHIFRQRQHNPIP